MKIKLVQDWQRGWRWFSTWAFALVIFLASVDLPPEVLALIPPVMQDKLTAVVAVCGLVLRFINQTKHPVGGGHD